MMFADRPQVRELSGGRLHLSHGPIDVVLRAWGKPAAVAAAYAAAASRFGGILPELCAELPKLRMPIDGGTSTNATCISLVSTSSPRSTVHWVPASAGMTPVDSSQPPNGRHPRGGGDPGHLPTRNPASSRVGQRMVAACRPFAGLFVTPMAAVAGAVADELMAVMLSAAELEKAYVNDGGDIAIHCAPGAALDIGVAGEFGRGPVPALNGTVHVAHGDGVGGIATSGAHGRSFSLGIADSVTVLAADAATADVAATLIANAVDFDHPAIVRQPASALDPDSDLGDRPVTVKVGPLPRDVVLAALEAGHSRAQEYLARGLIVDAALMLQGETASLFANAASGVGWVEGQRRPSAQGQRFAGVGSALHLTRPAHYQGFTGDRHEPHAECRPGRNGRGLL